MASQAIVLCRRLPVPQLRADVVDEAVVVLAEAAVGAEAVVVLAEASPDTKA